MRLPPRLSHILCVCLFIDISFSVFADEAYQVDHHYALLGIVQAQNTFFHQPSPDSKASLIYALSNNGIVGAVNPKDGAVLWRQRLHDKGPNSVGQSFLKAGEGSNLIFSALNGTVQAWDATDGRLAWTWSGTGKVKALEVLGGQPGVNEILVLSQEQGANGIVRCILRETGAVKWEYVDSSGDVPHSLIYLKGKLFYISLHSALRKGFKIKTTELGLDTGKRVGPPDVGNSESEVSSEDLILFAGTVGDSPTIIWADKNFKTVKVTSIFKKQTTTITVPWRNGGAIDSITVHGPSDAAAQSHLLLHFQGPDSHWAQIFHINPTTGVTEKADELPTRAGKGSFSTSSHGPDVYFVRHTNSEVSLVSSKSADYLTSWNILAKNKGVTSNLRNISHAVSEVVRRSGPKFSIRSALALTSGDWELIRNGESLWVRPEGLTGLVASAFTEIPRGKDLAQQLAVEGQYNLVMAYAHRLQRHIRDIQHLPIWIWGKYKNLGAHISGDEAVSLHLSSEGDNFGFKKIVVLATRQGRLAGIDTGDHCRVIWSIQAVSLELGSTWDVVSMDVEYASVLIRAAEGEFLRVESSTGKVLEHQPRAMVPGLDTMVAVIDRRGQQALISVNTDGSLGEIPATDFGDGTIVVTKTEGNVVRGWSLERNSKAMLAWQFVPFAGQIQEMIHRPAHDPVAAIGKPLGDRNVLYKYLNPNAMLITAVDAQNFTVSFYLLDSTSGTLLYSTTHSDVDISQPISSTISENVFVYSLFSKAVTKDPLQMDDQKLTGYQLVVSELYESPYPNDRGPLGSLPNFTSTQPIMSGEDRAIDRPHVISQTFLVPGPISRMSMTSTSQGITPRSLLCVVPFLNALVAIPRHFIDPRRPVGRDPTTAEIEEGLFRYSPSLDFVARWSLNHKREVMGFSNVVTKPSLLESTSLVFAYGDVDIFSTRFSPIGTFDILGSGFSKLQLVGTVAALAVGTGLLAPLVRKKQIDGRWQA
ncbi:MAG: hypothetical protein Q9163_003933 [Psora crenata]